MFMPLKDLNPEQKKAVSYGNGPLLIVAGAGTGKTTVITERIAWLIEQGHAKADEILALTFTDKAAGEMEERVDRLLPYGYTDLWIMTFHSFCQRALQQHGLDIGIPNDFKLLNQTEQWMLVRENLDKFNLDYYRPLGNPTKFIHALIKHFSRCKDEEIWPADYLAYAEKLKINLDSMESTQGKGRNKQQTTNNKQPDKNKEPARRSIRVVSGEGGTGDEVNRLEEIANAYHVYQQLLLDNESLDFGDLINYALKLFRERNNILKRYQQQFKYVLVDEFQDTNWAQYELVKLLVGDDKNLAVVGDDDQCLPGHVMIDMADDKKKRIDKIRKGDKVVSAVGKGHLGVYKVNKIFVNKKKARLLTITTKNGNKIQVTDNHKMFCFVPKKSNGKYHYVYLMFRQDLGWRMGVTNDLAVRLKLERSADYIFAVKAFESEEEARYYETLWSLIYGIPTACFKKRNSLMLKDDWLDKLYQDIDVEGNVKRLAKDLNIDLDSHHYCLDGVTRGRSKRILIHFEMCYRKYRSKHHVRNKRELMYNNLISHQVSMETSNHEILYKLKKAGYKLHPSKKGQRLRITNADIRKIGQEALKLQKITSGFISYKFNLGKINYQTLPAIVMPAKNLVEGHYLPIRRRHKIFYDEIISIKSKNINQKVYDLEVDKTHNFIANGVAVHNSIYKFRGASVSNILQFKEDFPDSKEVYLNKNYRSSQNILDMAYNFIQFNNPERLEVKLVETQHAASLPNVKKQKLSKKLNANTNEKGIIEHLHASDESGEVKMVIEKIIELKSRDAIYRVSEKSKNNDLKGDVINRPYKQPTISWNDFCILVRANSQAESFLNGLAAAEIPHNFVASKGLYTKEVIMDVMAYLKLLDDYHESLALWRILNLPMINIKTEDLMQLNGFSTRKAISLFETCQQVDILRNIEEETKRKVKKILKLISDHSKLAKEKSVKKIVLKFLEDFNYEKYLLKKNETQAFTYLNQLAGKIDEFENSFNDKSVKNFTRLMDLELESGERGSLSPELEEGPEAVKIMTIHAAKGLEFKYVFIVNLVDKRFPSIDRKEVIDLPDELVKEIIPSGDIHLQEERRLFYVAMTRAKQCLFFTSADNYGGTRKKKLSRFLYEIGLTKEDKEPKKQDNGQQKNNKLQITNYKTKKVPITNYQLPITFSYSQLKAFETCPYQYFLSFILRVPTRGKAVFSFGKTMHATLHKFFSLIKEGGNITQADLFSDKQESKKTKKKKNIPPFEELLNIYQETWFDDWYESKEQKEKYRKKGKESLKNLYNQIKEKPPQVMELERGFNFKIENYTIRGVIDRVDKIDSNKIEIIDYKTGSPKTEKNLEKDQLLIYQIAASETFGWQVQKLTFYYLDNNTRVSFLGNTDEINKMKDKIAREIEEIKNSNFIATPSAHKCKYCDFNSVCSFRVSS